MVQLTVTVDWNADMKLVYPFVLFRLKRIQNTKFIYTLIFYFDDITQLHTLQHCLLHLIHYPL